MSYKMFNFKSSKIVLFSFNNYYSYHLLNKNEPLFIKNIASLISSSYFSIQCNKKFNSFHKVPGDPTKILNKFNNYCISKRSFSGKGFKPTWIIKKDQMYYPQIKDKYHYGEHPTYTYFTLWLRNFRIIFEKIVGDTIVTCKSIYNVTLRRFIDFFCRRNIGFTHQCVAVLVWTSSFSFLVHKTNSQFQDIVDCADMIELEAAHILDQNGFWRSKSEEIQHRMQKFYEDHKRLREIWQEAIDKATVDRSFDTLVSYIKVNEEDVKDSVPMLNTWRFNVMPYGKDNPDTFTFDTPDKDKPLRSFALNFTYNNLTGNWGDYVDRKDNKGPILRPARMMLTDVYIPPTK